ncbi:spondin domain-containing protein [Chryseobacterium sp. L7]|uniref:Spondin domain-containing protein n=1 Tax=Chryseobacterium endalhagicum TaxID=2797638 RepID=A0ABS1QGI9_9FLAO|nr:spondin domain-containing protein [Chryseobacterium endalhagicum]MBL1221729.1 spondin domain-containing protein [Chryseobacterium endalhagicum]
MKKTVFKTASLALGIAAAFILTSCSDDDDMMMGSSSVQRTITFENVTAAKDFVQSGSFQGTGNPVILPGQSVSITFSAGKAQSLMFATMYGASKDWFFASKQPGIKLFDNNGNAITGDVSSEVLLWDNGTKNNTTGLPESNLIAPVPNVNASQLMKLNLSYNEVSSEFTLTISNNSGGTANETPFSPGVWAVSNYNGMQLLNSTPFFTANTLSNPEITDIAQMGNINKMVTKLNANTGIMTGLSPALVVVYSGDKNPVYELGQTDAGKGLKEIAQMGNVSKLQNSLKTLPNVKGVYIAGNAPVAPGSKVMTQFTAAPGDKIAYVTMFGFSNDWFYANEQSIDANTKGDLTSKTSLFDSGTGVDQYPGAGNRQALFGGTPQSENKAIAKVGNVFPVPAVQNIIKVTVD